MSAADPFFQAPLVPFSEPWGVYGDPSTEIFASITASGSQGIYEARIQLGSARRAFEFTLDSYSVPDRFQLIYNSAIVADSLFVGGYMPVSRTLDLPKFLLHNNSVFLPNGNESITISPLDYASDALTRANGSNGLQLGVVANYPAPEALAMAANVKLRFNKTTSSPDFVTLRVLAPENGTAWELSSLQML
jgi:hypothetical protein